MMARTLNARAIGRGLPSAFLSGASRRPSKRMQRTRSLVSKLTGHTPLIRGR